MGIGGMEATFAREEAMRAVEARAYECGLRRGLAIARENMRGRRNDWTMAREQMEREIEEAKR